MKKVLAEKRVGEVKSKPNSLVVAKVFSPVGAWRKPASGTRIVFSEGADARLIKAGIKDSAATWKLEGSHVLMNIIGQKTVDFSIVDERTLDGRDTNGAKWHIERESN